jgi:hypothetical protein
LIFIKVYFASRVDIIHLYPFAAGVWIFQGGSIMKIQQIREIAREHGVDPGKTTDKIELIRAIQHNEGNFDCFATAYEGVCDRDDCLWREDCFESARRGRLVA